MLEKEQRFSQDVHSKAYRSAIVNLSAKLPLPSTFYQNFRYRICYEEQLSKHTRFGNDFIYAFTWEDSRVDQQLLKIKPDDVVLCLCSAGDNLLDYLQSCRPRRIHSVDLNPNQCHLLELKVAAYQALTYPDFWKLFGEGRMPKFSEVLLNKLSPYLSSQALQFWATKASVFTSTNGLYEYGGSGRAIRLVRWLLRSAGLKRTVKRFCNARNLDEQRAIWPRLRSVLLNRPLHWFFVGTQFLWKAAGVPAEQAALITNDFHREDSIDPSKVKLRSDSGEAVWQYICNTFIPVARDTLISEDNFYYLLTLNGTYTKRCHPNYVSAKAHAKLSRPGAFDGLRIHTDGINDVVARIRPGTLTVAIIMDSMDWFHPLGDEAAVQIQAINKAMKLGGRLLLRSAGLKPWYLAIFERNGFGVLKSIQRTPGMCIDRLEPSLLALAILVRLTTT